MVRILRDHLQRRLGSIISLLIIHRRLYQNRGGAVSRLAVLKRIHRHSGVTTLEPKF
jgi:hypothetical protein